MKRFNLKTIKKWTNKSGEEMKKYYDAGELIINDNNQIIITLGSNPDVSIFAFSVEPKTAPVVPVISHSEFAIIPEKKSIAPTKQIDINSELNYGSPINPDDIPF